MKKISIIIPVYNAERYINRCMTSLARQSIGVDALEVILVNDCSTDSSLQYLYAWEKEFPESVCIVDLPQNMMQGAARNIGLEYASAPYIAYLDADDWLVPDALEIIYQGAVNTGAEITAYLSKDVTPEQAAAMGDALLLENEYESGMPDEYLVVKDVGDRIRLLFGGMSQRGCWDKLYRREFIQEYDLKYAEGIYDEEALFTIPALMHVRDYLLINKYLHRYFDNAAGTTGSLLKQKAHLHDNELTCMRVLEKLRKDGILKKEPEVSEAVFVHNYFNRSLTCTHPRGLFYDAAGLRMLQNTVHKCFPSYDTNPILINMRSFPYMKKLLEMKITDDSVDDFYRTLTEWEKIIGSEV